MIVLGVYQTNFQFRKAARFVYTFLKFECAGLVMPRAAPLSLATAQCRGRARDNTKPANPNLKNSYRQNGRLFEIKNWFSINS